MLVLADVEVGEPGRGQVRLRQTAIGVNYIDVYHRTGLYPLQLPAVLGREAAGVVEAVGEGVGGIQAGDRVAYVLQPGAYTDARLIDAQRLIPLPDFIDDLLAAAMMLKGLTAHYLLRLTYRVEAGDTLLIHAAAGWFDRCQWANSLEPGHRNRRLAQKAERARKLGAITHTYEARGLWLSSRDHAGRGLPSSTTPWAGDVDRSSLLGPSPSFQLRSRRARSRRSPSARRDKGSLT